MLRLVSSIIILSFVVLACSGPQDRDQQALEDSDFHYHLAIGHYQAREVPIAIRELLTSLEYHPDNAQSLFLLGFIYHGRRDYVEAERYYLAALEARPDWAEVQNNLGTVYLETERWNDAVDVFLALTRNPIYGTPGHAHNNLGWAYYNLGMTDEALDQFELAVMFQPEHCLAYNNRGLLLDEMGNEREARRAFEQAISRCESYPEPRYRLGVLLSQDPMELDRAQELFQECYELMPESAFGQRCLEYLSVTQLR